jgi:hypothetical protein
MDSNICTALYDIACSYKPLLKSTKEQTALPNGLLHMCVYIKSLFSHTRARAHRPRKGMPRRQVA